MHHIINNIRIGTPHTSVLYGKIWGRSSLEIHNGFDQETFGKVQKMVPCTCRCHIFLERRPLFDRLEHDRTIPRSIQFQYFFFNLL